MPKPDDNPPTVPPTRPRWLNALAVAYLVAITLLSYGNALFPSNTFLPADLLLLRSPYHAQAQRLEPGFQMAERLVTDPLFQFHPARKYLRESLRADYLPLWNPLSFCGTPFAADDQSAVFYPPNWLYAVLPLAQAFGWVAALHTFLAGLFFWLWGRRMGWSHVAALCGATVWMLCGVMVAWQMWQVVDDSLCWLPLALYFWEGFRATRSARQGVGVAAALGLSLLAGHFQFGFYVWLTTFVYMLYRPVAKPVLPIAGILALGAGLSFVQVAATGDLLLRTLRSHVTLDEQLATALPFKQIVMLFAPDLFGGQRQDLLSMLGWTVTYKIAGYTLTHGPYAGLVNLNELTVYCGVVASLLAVFGLRLRQRGDLSRLWLGLIVFALLMGLGTPLYAFFFHCVPLFKSFHGVARVFALLDFAVAALCATGAQRMLSLAPAERKQVAIYGFAGVGVLMTLGLRMATSLVTPEGDVGYALMHDWMANGHVIRTFCVPLLILVVATTALILAGRHRWVPLALVAADMLLFSIGFNGGQPARILYPPTAETDFITRNVGEGRVLCLADSRDNYQSRLMPNAAMSLGWRDVAGNNPLVLARYDRFMRAVNVQLAGSEYPSGVGIIPRTGPILDQCGLKYVLSPSRVDIPGYKLAFAKDAYVYENENYGKARPAGTTITDRFGTETIAVSDSSPVVASQAINEPGWQIFIDGVKTANSDPVPLFIQIPVSPGKHEIVLRYLPAPVQFGLYVTLLSLAVGTMLVARRRLPMAV